MTPMHGEARHPPTGRVLVLGDNDLAGLAIVRSLGRAGLDVHLVHFEASAVTRSSRYVRRRYDFGHPLQDALRFREQVVELLRTTRFDLVIPVSDASLIAMMPCREGLMQWAAFAAPDQQGFDATNDKARTWRLAQECHVPTPATMLVEDAADVERAVAAYAYQLVLKPVRSVAAGHVQRRAVRIADHPDAARQWLPEMLRHGPVLVQSFFPGQGVGVSILGDRGKVVAAFQHVRLHEPPRGGAGSYRQSVQLDPVLLDWVERMCQALAWTGPAMFEFKQAPDDGDAVLMEINGRFWGSLPLAIHAGVDFPLLLYKLLVLREAVNVRDYRVPVFARYLPQEPYWLLANFRAPANRPDVLKRDWKAIAGEVKNLLLLRETWDVESISDPWPACQSWKRMAGELLRGLRAKLRERRARRGLNSIRRVMRRNDDHFRQRLAAARQILVLCHGNINRSPLAAARLRQNFADQPAAPRVVSAGFVPQSGRPTSDVSLAVAERLGIDLREHRSTVLNEVLIRESDLIVVMDARNVVELAAAAPAAQRKMVPLGALDDEPSVEIDDPYGQTAFDFESTYGRIVRCADQLCERWLASRIER